MFCPLHVVRAQKKGCKTHCRNPGGWYQRHASEKEEEGELSVGGGFSCQKEKVRRSPQICGESFFTSLESKVTRCL